MLPWSAELAGRLDEHVIASELLRGNPLGDPSERPLWVYVPPGYDAEPDRRYPSVYVIQGYTGHVAMWRNRTPFRQPFLETADAVFARGDAPPAIVVYVDAWTAYGGSQFVDSPGTGRYHSYLCDEVVPWVDARYRTRPDAAHRAITGKSSGGFGAMITPMLRPDLFGALATHAGRHPVRAVLPARLRRGGPGAARLRRRHLALVGRLPVPGRLHQAGRPGAAGHPGRRGLLLGPRGRDGRAAVRPPDGGAAPGGLGAVAGLGPGPDGAPVRHGAALAAGDLDRRGHGRRLLPRPRRGGVPRGAAPTSASPTRWSASSCSTPPTRRSTTATRSRWPGSASGYRTEQPVNDVGPDT